MRLVTFSKKFTHGADDPTLSDVFVLTPTKDIYISAIYFSTQASGITAIWKLVKRSAANTGGTSVAVTAAPWGTNSPDLAVTAAAYTANPSAVGAQVGGDFRNTPFTFVNGQPSANLEKWRFYRADPAHRGIRIAAGEFAALNVVGLTAGAAIEVTAYVWAEDVRP